MINAFKTAMLLTVLSVLLLIVGQSLGGDNGLVIALVFAIAMNFGSYWFSDKVVLRMYRAQEVGPEHPLHQLTAELADRAELPMPRVYVIPTATPNAFATGRNPTHAAVAATEGILRTLSRDELAGVIAHELAHIQNRDILTASIAATVAAAIIQAAISRSREFAADAAGAEIAGSPNGLASALRKIEAGARATPLPAGPAAQATEHMFIVKPFSGGGALRLFSTHPPTEERVARLLGSRV